MKYDNQLRYAVNIIKDYDGRYPLSAWLKDFFSENKQMGSRDRKTLAELVYGYFRLGHNQFKNIEERLLAGLYAGNHLKELIDYFSPTRSAPEPFSVDKIFPWSHHLSEGIDSKTFAESFLVQPNLFIRIRPGREKDVFDKLNAAGVEYSTCGDTCIALPNATKTDTLLEINKEAVVQDKSSQETAALLNDISFRTVWDCCAASGGKSIMIYDLNNTVKLTVSDIRESIISNLKSRFTEAGIKDYHPLIADLSSANVKLPEQAFELIVADVPCTGSGTWSRTPEQLYFFDEQKIAYYAKLQQQIVRTALSKLSSGGHLLYITCSVFKQENEDMVTDILSDKNVELVKKMLIKGYDDRADTMFAALFKGAPA